MKHQAKWIVWWNLGCGTMDALTGLVLVMMPVRTLDLLGIAVAVEATVFVRWIGVFVAGVGLSYGLALWRREWLVPAWLMTAGVRAMVAVFVGAMMVAGGLDAAWAGIALTDGLVAAIQFYVLAKGGSR